MKQYFLQYDALGYQIDAYLPEYKLAIEIDENDHFDRNINKEITTENRNKQKLPCKFIRINPDKKGFNIFVEIGKIFNHIINVK